MILDLIERARLYAGVHKDFLDMVDKALALKDAQPGRYEFGEHAVLIQHPQTRDLDGAEFEAHEKFIDVQMILQGAEQAGWAPLEQIRITKPLNPEKDVKFGVGQGSRFTASAGMFYFLFPTDAHAPNGRVNDEKLVKAVVKLKV